jgi:hypothetical protein
LESKQAQSAGQHYQNGFGRTGWNRQELHRIVACGRARFAGISPVPSRVLAAWRILALRQNFGMPSIAHMTYPSIPHMKETTFCDRKDACLIV